MADRFIFPKGFLMIPREIAINTDLSNSAKIIFAMILDSTTRDLVCTATDGELADFAKTSISTVKRAILALKNCGYIKSETRRDKFGVTNRYIYLLINENGNRTHWR